MQITFVPADASAQGGALALLHHEGAEPGPAAQAFDAASDGALTRALAQGRFKGAKGASLDLIAPAGDVATRVLVVGGGKPGEVDAIGVEHAAASAFHALKSSGAETLTIAFDLGAEEAARAAYGIELAAYRFDRYRTREKPDAKPTVTQVRIAVADPAAAEAAFAPLAAVAEGVLFTRDLVSEPPNILFPDEFARRVVERAGPLGLAVEVLDEPAMEALGMGSLLAVGHGSVRDSRLVVIRWNGAEDADAQPIAFVGKGVTFDTGGISIKPADGMDDMKFDMGGAGAVAGLMVALAGRKAKVNAVGILGLVENMPDGAAMRPGDVLTSMSGQTIEVLNTDAEGRLVLADALWYCQDRFKPRFMVDLATLTGAVIVSLGNDYAGLFTGDDALNDGLMAASKAEGEFLWRLPLPAAYDKLIDSPVADVKNIGGRAGGSITAALFLQRFTNGVPWAHLDIAGTVWRKGPGAPTYPEGATGFGVRLLDRFVRDGFEG